MVPLLLMLFELSFAGREPALTFFVVPVAGLTLFAVRLLPELWAAERRSVHRSVARVGAGEPGQAESGRMTAGE